MYSDRMDGMQVLVQVGTGCVPRDGRSSPIHLLGVRLRVYTARYTIGKKGVDSELGPSEPRQQKLQISWDETLECGQK